MKIGIVSHADISVFTPYFEGEFAINLLMNRKSSKNATAVTTLILAFLSEGHHICLYVLSDETFILKSNKIDIYGIKAFDKYPWKYFIGDFKDALNIKKTIASSLEDIDILHAHWTYSYAFAASFFTNRLTVFCTVRDWAPYIWKIESLKNKVTWSFKAVMNWLVFRNGNIHFIANSQYTASLILKNYKLKVPVIANPIKQSFLKMDERVVPDSLEIVCISSSNDMRKNVVNLLYSFKKILEQYPNAHLTLIGPPFEKESSIITKWRRDGLLNHVSLVGQVNHELIIAFLDKARVFVSPSLEETFGNTLLESMARKVPVIAGLNSGAVPYVLHGGDAGFLCDVSNVDQLIKTILFVYEHPEVANNISENAFIILVNEYNPKMICEKHINYYEKYL